MEMTEKNGKKDHIIKESSDKDKNFELLKTKKVAELIQIAKELKLSGYSDLKKQELIFKIIEATTQKDGYAFAAGVLAGESAFGLSARPGNHRGPARCLTKQRHD